MMEFSADDFDREWARLETEEEGSKRTSYTEFEGQPITNAFIILTERLNSQQDTIKDLTTAVEYLSIELKKVQRAYNNEPKKVYI